MRRLITSILLSGAISLQLQAEVIRVSASDLLSDFIAEPLQWDAEQRGEDFEIKGIGSVSALERLRAGQADLAIIAIPTDAAWPEGDFNVEPFAYDVAVVVVNNDNPLNEVTLSQLGGIFGGSENYNFTTWDQLGLRGWDRRGIKSMAAQNSDSVSLELFKHSVLMGGKLKSGVAMVKAVEVERLVESDSSAIAVLSSLPQSEKIKPLMLSLATDKPAFGPTENNIHYGDYPIRLAFYLVYRSSDSEKLGGLLHSLYSDEVAQVLTGNHLFSLPDTVRRQFQTDLQFLK